MNSLPADDVQRARHMAKQMAEHAEIMYAAFAGSRIPREVVDQLIVVWWTELWRPRMPDLPDFAAIFGKDE